VIVSGRLKQRSYETREGEKRSVVELEVDEIGPSLRNARVTINKVARNGGGRSGQGGRGGQSAGEDPWGSAPAGGSFGGQVDDEPPF
jgi:single-strand DNA-binding protein